MHDLPPAGQAGRVHEVIIEPRPLAPLQELLPADQAARFEAAAARAREVRARRTRATQ
jgi:hypothetical protein